ncbi:Fe(3+)-citrate-binding protein YfmC precursor [compost metagenome]
MPVSLEKLAELDADHIFLVNSEGAGTAEALKRSIWLSLPAVKAGHVYTMPKERSWLYSGIIANEGIVDDVLQSLGVEATN